jgi:hypothetical protein
LRFKKIFPKRLYKKYKLHLYNDANEATAFLWVKEKVGWTWLGKEIIKKNKDNGR